MIFIIRENSFVYLMLGEQWTPKLNDVPRNTSYNLRAEKSWKVKVVNVHCI